MLLFIGILLPGSGISAEPVILVLGDSLSAGYGVAHQQGWVWLLQDRLARSGYPYRVINASISGDTTGGGLTRLPQLLAKHQPEILIIELGANDGLRGHGYEQIRENLTELIRLGQQAGAKIQLIGVRLPPNYGAAYIERFQGLYQDLAREHGVALTPHLLAGVAEDRDLMQPDGLHPSTQAQPLLLDNVWPALKQLLDHP